MSIGDLPNTLVATILAIPKAGFIAKPIALPMSLKPILPIPIDVVFVDVVADVVSPSLLPKEGTGSID